MNNSGGIVPQNRNTIVDVENNSIITPEMRAYYMPFTDPLTLNFKILLDFGHKEGLLADESNADSALAYLKRIGENERYDLLKVWIKNFQDLFQYYDFLVIGADGMDEAVCFKLHEKHTAGKFTLNIRETVDMKVQSLINTYQQIWYDFERDVQVIPKNLKRIPLAVLIYSSGYFNSSFYDMWKDVKDSLYLKMKDMNPTLSKESFDASFAGNANDVYRTVLPTYKKLNRINSYNDIKSSNTNSIEKVGTFSYSLIYFPCAYIDDEDSGRPFFSNLTNLPSGDFVTNAIAFNYYATYHSGMFPNLYGQMNIANVLAMVSAQNKMSNVFSASTGGDMSGNVFEKSYWESWLDKIQGNFYGTSGEKIWFKNFKNSWKSFGKDFVNNEMNDMKNKYFNMLKTWSNSLGNNIRSFTDPNLLSNVAKGSMIKLISKAESEFYERAGMGDINKLITTNYNQTAVNAFYNIESNLMNDLMVKMFPENNEPQNAANTTESQNGTEYVQNSPRLSRQTNKNEYYDAETADPNIEKGIRLFNGIPTNRNIYNRKSL